MARLLNSGIGALLFVVALATPAYAAKQAIVAKRTIYPGQIIERTNLQAVILRKKPLIRYRFVQEFNELIGKVASKTILAGRFIRTTSAKTAMLIKAGTRTRIELRAGGLSISLVAVALSDASAGDEVRFRNPNSGKTFFGIVQEDGRVVAQSL